MHVLWLSTFVDMAADRFGAGAEFWRRVTETTLSGARCDHGESTHAHVDVSCGDTIEEIAAHHTAVGATQPGRAKVWMAMSDPAGLPYCLTPRRI